MTPADAGEQRGGEHHRRPCRCGRAARNSARPPARCRAPRPAGRIRSPPAARPDATMPPADEPEPRGVDERRRSDAARRRSDRSATPPSVASCWTLWPMNSVPSVARNGGMPRPAISAALNSADRRRAREGGEDRERRRAALRQDLRYRRGAAMSIADADRKVDPAGGDDERHAERDEREDREMIDHDALQFGEGEEGRRGERKGDEQHDEAPPRGRNGNSGIRDSFGALPPRERRPGDDEQDQRAFDAADPVARDVDELEAVGEQADEQDREQRPRRWSASDAARTRRRAAPPRRPTSRMSAEPGDEPVR